MYCSSCGSSVAQNLTYCNRCGARVGGGSASIVKASEISAHSLVWSMIALFVFGTGVIIGLMGVMKQVVGFNPGLITALVLVWFGLLLLLEGVLISLMFRKHRKHNLEDPGLLPDQSTKGLEGSPPRGLPEHMPSVTEQTTRAFEPIYTERK